MKAILGCLLVALTLNCAHANELWTTTVFPQDAAKRWWSDAWWDAGKIDAPVNHDVTMSEVEYVNGDVEVPAYLFRPSTPGKYPAVLFQHGRRGLDDLTLKIPLRLAARGFVVLAPDVWSARFIEKYPIAHDYNVETDTARGIDYLLSLPGIKGDRACVTSHTRGGYLTLKALVTHGKQNGAVACYVSYYPHWQDPNAAEPMQVYRYAPEVEKLEVPTLVFIGENDQYQRIRPILQGIEALQNKGRDAEVIVYPGVGRGFDFRPPNVRTFADDLAAKDAAMRAAQFIRTHLGTGE
jgi:carboxymethylenebutenolidase